MLKQHGYVCNKPRVPKKKFKNRIKDFRQKKNLSQSALAKLLKTSQQQVHRWENGQTINFEMAIVLSKVLGQRPELIFPAFSKLRIDKESLNSPIENSEKIEEAIKKAGFETKESLQWHIRFELRGFKEPFIYEIDVEVARGVKHFLLSSGGEDECNNFKLFETSDGLTVAIKTSELTCCRIMYDYVSLAHEVLEEKKNEIAALHKADQTSIPVAIKADDEDFDTYDSEEDNERCLRIYTVNNDKLYTLSGLDQEELSHFMADLDNGWYNDNPYSELTDEDCEDFLIRNNHVALVEVPFDWYSGAFDDE